MKNKILFIIDFNNSISNGKCYQNFFKSTYNKENHTDDMVCKYKKLGKKQFNIFINRLFSYRTKYRIQFGHQKRFRCYFCKHLRFKFKTNRFGYFSDLSKHGRGRFKCKLLKKHKQCYLAKFSNLSGLSHSICFGCYKLLKQLGMLILNN